MEQATELARAVDPRLRVRVRALLSNRVDRYMAHGRDLARGVIPSRDEHCDGPFGLAQAIPALRDRSPPGAEQGRRFDAPLGRSELKRGRDLFASRLSPCERRQAEVQKHLLLERLVRNAVGTDVQGLSDVKLEILSRQDEARGESTWMSEVLDEVCGCAIVEHEIDD